MNIRQFLDAMDHMDDNMKMEVLDTMYGQKELAPKGRKISRSLLLTAVVAALLCVGVLAVALGRMESRDVSDESISGMWNGQQLSLEDAALELSFDISSETCYEVEFKPGWLPDEPEYPYSPHREGWYTHLSNWGDPMGELPYVIYSYTGAQLGNGTKCYLNGKCEIVDQREWKGWQRTDIHVDYRDTGFSQECMLDRYYILLFSQKDNYLIYIASSMYGFDTLEQMADGLTVEVTDRVAQSPEPGTTEVCYFDLGRG